MPEKSERVWTRADEFTIAGAAGCDPRTVRRALAGKSVRPGARERIREALRAHGYHHMIEQLKEPTRE